MKFYDSISDTYILFDVSNNEIEAGEEIIVTLSEYNLDKIHKQDYKDFEFEISIENETSTSLKLKQSIGTKLMFNTDAMSQGVKRFNVVLTGKSESSGNDLKLNLSYDSDNKIKVFEMPKVRDIKLNPPSLQEDISNTDFWKMIKSKTIDFKEYNEVIEDIMACNKGSLNGEDIIDSKREKQIMKNRLPFLGVNTYSLLKFATEAYMKKKCGYDNTDMHGDYFVTDSASSTKLLPYIDMVYEKIDEFTIRDNGKECFDENEIIRSRMRPFFIELIWSYWHEEGMLVKTMQAISARFQNVRNGGRDPLARIDIDPLRPLNNIFWGYIQDTQHRLNVTRRIYEYDHHYGISLSGNPAPVNSVDSRSKFIEAFHNLLNKCSQYYKEVDDMTRRADGFPLLNALKEVHLILAEGAHNQFGDLPSTARAEMLVEQYILSRPEIRDFLGGKIMVPYTEPWMDRVDTMKNMQGWNDTSITYFNKLAKYGEQLILSIRYDNWSDTNDAAVAGNWAIFWRNEIQQYIHSYFAVTGVDLSAETIGSSAEKYMIPSMLIQRKLQYKRANYLVR